MTVQTPSMTWHGEQARIDVAEGRLDHVPALHCMHAAGDAAPLVLDHVPALHDAHLPFN